MPAPSADAIQPALLFMPDISGFTDFVNNTEIVHAQNIIQELLDVLIESNQVNLEVGEIEGDAVFFYRLGNPPGLDQLLNQVQAMFTRFYQHLQLYDHQRICPCGACATAVNLKLKIFAHFGEVTGFSVKQHRKLFGRDVIVIHRLMKNNLDKKEYVLLTQSLTDAAKPSEKFPGWYQPEDASEKYDVGNINFKVADLSRLAAEVPPVEVPVYRMSEKTKVVFSCEKMIDASIWKIFGAIFDLEQRSSWMEGIKKIEMVTKDSINRVGTLHRCIIGQKNNPVMLTESAHVKADEIELTEIEQKGVAGNRFVLQKVNESSTKLKIDMLLRKDLLTTMFFNLFMKNKIKMQFEKSLDNLKELCGTV